MYITKQSNYRSTWSNNELRGISLINNPTFAISKRTFSDDLITRASHYGDSVKKNVYIHYLDELLMPIVLKKSEMVFEVSFGIVKEFRK